MVNNLYTGLSMSGSTCSSFFLVFFWFLTGIPPVLYLLRLYSGNPFEKQTSLVIF